MKKATLTRESIFGEIKRLKQAFDNQGFHASFRLDGVPHNNRDFYIQALNDIEAFIVRSLDGESAHN